MNPSAPSLSSKAYGYDGLVQAMASGELRLASGSNMQLYSSASNVLLGAGGMSNVISVSSNLVEIHGNVRVMGSIDSIATTVLHVRDKVLRIAYDAFDCNVPDLAIDGSGLELGTGADPGSPNCYERSIKWHHASGAGKAAMLTSGGASNEPFWELRGGGLRITTPVRKNSPGEVSYGMHINDREELVMYKVIASASGDKTYQRVFTFGSTADPLAIPTSINPFM